MATDYFGRPIGVGSIVWLPVTVNTAGSDVFAGTFTNVDGSVVTLTSHSGTNGQSTNPLEGDRPPRVK